MQSLQVHVLLLARVPDRGLEGAQALMPGQEVVLLHSGLFVDNREPLYVQQRRGSFSLSLGSTCLLPMFCFSSSGTEHARHQFGSREPHSL